MFGSLEILEHFAEVASQSVPRRKPLELPWRMRFGLVRESKAQRKQAVAQARAARPKWDPGKAPDPTGLSAGPRFNKSEHERQRYATDPEFRARKQAAALAAKRLRAAV